MTPVQAILLALIQGVTEFLPISSSAHLILMPYVLGWEDHGLRFDVVTNAGTLLAAAVYFRRDLASAAREMLTSASGDSALGGRLRWSRLWRPRLWRPRLKPGLLRALLVASLPALVAGAVFYDWFATVARHPVIIASSSIAFGVLLWWADRVAERQRRLGDLSWGDSLWIGLSQALALLPGTSRSGITITAGLFRGLDRPSAARFSFLLAIPVGVLALAKDLLGLARGRLPAAELLPLALGFAVSAVSAYLVIGWLLAWLRRQDLTVFVVYRIAMGVVILALVLVR